jgi:UDP-N-acetylmuramyl pentapeptide phosphotransferase/UDP-N-acetylglucosamine-1-phosphate transferase
VKFGICVAASRCPITPANPHAERSVMSGLSFPARLAFTALAVAAVSVIAGRHALGAAVMAAAFTAIAMPLFRRYAMARPNARSSHVTPTPQGGGAAVVAATLAAAAFALPAAAEAGGVTLPAIAAAAVMLALVGAVDDIRGVAVLPRLAIQLAATGLAIVAIGMGGRLLPTAVPYPVEFILLVVAGTWFVNLTNFMDGIDGITLAGFAPLAAAVVVLAMMGRASPVAGLVATGFVGALAGFAWFNLPRAMLFLGDVGSLPIGLIGGALLLDLALNGAFPAAVILPLYHFMDATMTLIARLARREQVWVAHRQHAYQCAVDGGWSHARVSGIVLALNAVLAGIALLSARLGAPGQALCVLAALALVIGVIRVFRARAALRS